MVNLLMAAAMTLPHNYFVSGGVEGTRVLFEDVPVHQIIDGAEGPLRHPRRRVASFQKKAKKAMIEEVALLDFQARHPLSEDDRLHCLKLLAVMFRRGE